MMGEKRFKKMDTIIDPFQIWDTVEEKGYNCTDTLDVLVDLFNELKKDVENWQEVVAEVGATLLMNGFEIEINGENLSELVVDDD